MAAETTDRLERSEPGRCVARGEGSPQIGAERDDHVDAARRHAWAPQAPEDGCRLKEIDVRAHVPFQKGVRVGALCEDPKLGNCHRPADAIDERSSNLAAHRRKFVQQ